MHMHIHVHVLYEEINFVLEIYMTIVLSSSLCRNLALGIGIQNFPEGLAVSLPLKASGLDTWKSFW